MKILTHEGLQYFYNQIAAKFSTKEQTAEAIEEAVGNAGVGTVTSVNGKTGVVQLSASDVGALPASTQIPSIAGLATETYVDNKVAAMVDSAPETLNTLNELAAALGDDPNFATTVATEIGGKVSKSGDTMTGRLKLTSSDGYPTLAFHAVGSDSYASAIQTTASMNRMSFIERATDTNYFESFQLPTPSTGLTESKYHNIITSKGGTINGSLIINANSLFVRNNVPMVNLQNADGSETMGALSGVANGSGSNYTVRLAARGKGTSFYEYYSTPYAANNLTANKYYDLLTTRSAVTVAQGGTGATTADSACANLGAVKKSGDIMTGQLTATQLNASIGNGYTIMAADRNNKTTFLLQQDVATSRVQLMQIHPNSAFAERYRLPYANAEATADTNYDILTTKNTITIAQGGTGATTAEGALTNLGALPLSGGTLTGALSLPGNLYAEGDTLDATQHAINMNNSNIVGVNGIYMNDAADGITEGVHFYRSATTYDSLWAASGKLYFTPNRPLSGAGTAYTVYHTGNKPTEIVSGTSTLTTGIAATPILYLKKNGYSHWAIERAGDTDNRLIWHYYDPTTGNWTGNAFIIDSNNWVDYALPRTPAQIEFMPGTSANHGGYIDFHFNSSSADYTSRIIESASGELTMNNYCKLFNSGRQMQLTGSTSDDTAYARFIASTSSGSVALQASTNWGVYDITGSRWLIHVNKSDDSSNVNIAGWASIGSSTQPVYFNNKGRPVACTAVAITNGGTGATSEVAAANNLKVQSLGHGTDIPANANLNTYTTVGNYRCSSTNTAATIANCPVANAFTLQVYAATGTSTSAPTTAGWAYFIQKFTILSGAQYYRTIAFSNSTTASFGDWVKIYDTNNKPTASEIGAMPAYPGSIEFATSSSANNGGFIDFHFNGSTADYTSRIIEEASGVLQINGATFSNGTITATKIVGAVYA